MSDFRRENLNYIEWMLENLKRKQKEREQSENDAELEHCDLLDSTEDF